jgi:hypothetical protein
VLLSALCVRSLFASLCVAAQALGFSKEFTFMTGPPVGHDSSIRFLAVADLGHAEPDGSTEIDYDQSRDMLNYTPADTLQYVRLRAPSWGGLHWTLCHGLCAIGPHGRRCNTRKKERIATLQKVDKLMAVLLAQVFEMFYDFLVDSEAQQGASLYTLNGLLGSAANSTLLLHNGDVSYARCAVAGSLHSHPAPAYEHCSATHLHFLPVEVRVSYGRRGQLTQWDVFMSQMQPLASQMPWMLTEGNHERDWPYSGDRFSNLALDSGEYFPCRGSAGCFAARSRRSHVRLTPAMWGPLCSMSKVSGHTSWGLLS